MPEPWNLTPQQWSNVLEEGWDPGKVAEELKSGQVLPWAEIILKYSGDSQKTLDLGSGRGEHSALLALQGKTTTLFDWSPKNLEMSQRLYNALGLKGTFVQGDMTKRLPFEDNAFDTVFSCGVFEYFTDEQIKAILKEAFRLAGKRVIIMVPNAWSIFYRFGKWYMEARGRWQWGGEKPFATLKPHFKSAQPSVSFKEYSVGTKHSLNFLRVPGGRTMQKLMTKGLGLTNHSRPSRLNQGYLLVAIGEKH
jgi:SAM-dependent methyltransferase